LYGVREVQERAGLVVPRGKVKQEERGELIQLRLVQGGTARAD